MLKVRNALWLGLLFIFGSATASYAQYGAPPGEQGAPSQQEGIYLGRAHVDSRHDHDDIHVGRDQGPFQSIQLQVNGGPVEFDHVVVHFANGSSEPVQIRYRIEDGGRTRLIDLPGEQRRIRSVELWYAKARWEGRPQVSLFGYR